MEIGDRLKQARNEQKLTQENLAEQLGVSRQTISNWENNRSYPDIINLIALSKIYNISLDELLGEDRKMIEHLEESTNTVKSRQQLSGRILLAAYLLIWAITIIAYWVGSSFSGIPFGVLNMVLYVCTFIFSVFIGFDLGRGTCKWLTPFFFAAMHLLVSWLTFYLSILILHFSEGRSGIILPDLSADIVMPGFVCSMVGVLAGTIFKRIFAVGLKEFLLSVINKFVNIK